MKQIFTTQEQILIKSLEVIEEEYALKTFPTNKQTMKMSQYYVVPSMIEKYKILNEKAEPILGV